MKVVFFHRKPVDGYFSLEGYFQIIRDNLQGDIKCVVAESRFSSKGFLGRMYNILEAFFRQGDVNHITGDVHFLSYFLRKRRTILTVHDCGFTELTDGFKRSLIKYLWYVIPERRVSIITAISDSTKRELLKIVPCNPDKIRVIPICISPEYEYKEKTFNKHKPKILQVGTTRNKNLMRLFEALHGVNCCLHIVGKLSMEQLEAIQRYNIEYINSWNLSKSEMINKYIDCDLIAFVSTYEGFGMPILEANAIGRAIVTSKVTSMPEVAGSAACMVNPYDINEIRAGILKVINDDAYREELVENGRLNVLRFRPDIIAKQYARLYEELLFGARQI